MAKGISIPPYYDTYDGTDSNYVRVLFRAGATIQSRELNEIQTAIAEQIERFGRHMFKEGSPVTGGALSVSETFLVLVDSSEDVSSLSGKTVEFRAPGSSEASAVATVGATAKATSDHPQVIAVSFITKSKPSPRDIIVVDSTPQPMTVADRQDAVHRGLVATIQNGVYFFGGRFVKVDAHDKIISVLNPQATGDVGLLWKESIVTAETDSYLLDPALGLSNYGAAGAHRLAVDTEIAFISVGETAPENFVKLLEIEQGRAKTVPVRPVHAEIGKMLARRTWEESGDYTVDPYSASMQEYFQLGVLDVFVGPNGDRTNIRIVTGMPHEFSVGDDVVVSNFPEYDDEGNVTSGFQEHMNDVFKVTKVVDDFTFEFVTATEPSASTPEHINCRAYDAPSIKVASPDYMSLVISEGSAYVRGFEIDHKYKHVIKYRRARDTYVEPVAIAFPVGNVVIVTSVSGYVDQWATVALKDAAGDTVATATARNFRHYSGAYGATGKWILCLSDVSAISGKDLGTARTIEAPGFQATIDAESIVNGSFAMKEVSTGSSLLYEVAADAIKTFRPDTDSEFTYQVWKRYTGVAAGGIVSFYTAGNDKFLGATTDFAGTELWSRNYVLVNTDTGTITNPSSVVVSTGYDGITCSVPDNDNYVLLAATVVTNAIRTKTVDVVDISIPKAAWNVNNRYALGFADAIGIVGAWDSGVAGVPATDNDKSIRNTIVLYPNRTKTAYLESVIEATTPPKGDVLIRVRRYRHDGSGPFTVDSYVGHRLEEIPKEEHGGIIYDLARCIDWRPVVISGSVASNDVAVVKGSYMEASAEIYSNRADIVTLMPTGDIRVIEGEPSKEGFKPPTHPEDSMTLFEISVPAYTATADVVKIKTLDNRRYTMRDIGKIDKRLERVEYYTSLSLLEMRVKSEPVYDKDGRERFKNGFIVDDFSGDGPGWVQSAEWRCQVVPQDNVCRPRFLVKNEALATANEPSHGTTHGEGSKAVVTLPYQEVPVVSNLNPTKKEFVTPYLVSDYVGTLTLSPDVDDWYDDSHETKRIELEMDDIVINQTIDVTASGTTITRG